MGNCCSTGSSPPAPRGLEASGTASSSSVVDPSVYHPAVGVATGVGVGVVGDEHSRAHGRVPPPQDMTSFPYAVTPEPQQLEHIADREGTRLEGDEIIIDRVGI